MLIRRFRTQLRLRQLHLIYDQLPAPAQQRLYEALRQLSKGQDPPRVWITFSDELEELSHESTI